MAKESRLIETELTSLRQMEEEAARFGSAVGLDSVSTFECIVSNSDHFFMEMNTRIQVEHRVSELCYGLKFINPSNPNLFQNSFKKCNYMHAISNNMHIYMVYIRKSKYRPYVSRNYYKYSLMFIK